MGWSIGFDSKWQRDIGYGVPAQCDHPDCATEIHRGLHFVCGGQPYGGEHGCGLFFCDDHMLYTIPVNLEADLHQVCSRCFDDEEPFPPKPDSFAWLRHKLLDESWQQWRDQNPEQVRAALTAAVEGEQGE